MNENSTPQKILSFLQSALLKQKDVQQFLHFRPSAGASEALDDSHFIAFERILFAGQRITIHHEKVCYSAYSGS